MHLSLAWLLAATLGVFVPSAAGAAQPTEPAESTDSTEATDEAVTLSRPDEAAALTTARLTGKRVQITGATTEFSTSIANPDGTVSFESSVEPQRAQQADGSWRGLDLTLAADAQGRLRPATSIADVSFSGGGSTPLVELVSDGGSLTLSWQQALPEPVVDGDTATYPEVRPGVDLVVRATTTGFSHLWAVKNRAAAAGAQELRLEVGGDATVSTEQGGALHAKADGRLLAVAAPPVMWDSSELTVWQPDADVLTGSGRPMARPRIVPGAQRSSAAGPGDGAKVRDVAVRLTADGGLTLRPDAALLAGTETSFPVFVDPSWNVTSAKWAYANSINSNWDVGGRAWVGRNPSDGTLYRSFFDFDVSAIRGKYVQSASVTARLDHSWSCSPTWTHLYRTSNITVSSGARMAWSTRPLPSSVWLDSAEGNANEAGGCGSTQPDMTMTFERSNLLNDVRQAATANWTLYTVGFCACNDQGQYETAQDRWKKFYTNQTKLLVTYTSLPTVGTRSTVPTTSCVTGSTRPFVNTTTPQLRSVINDPESAAVKAEFEWWAVGGAAKIGSVVTGSAASGSTLSATVPSGALANGGNYMWRVRGNDGIVNGGWSSYCEFSVDTTAPGAPTVTSTAYPAGQWAGDPGTPGSFTFGANGSTDVTSYSYGLNVTPPDQSVAAPGNGQSATVQITPTNEGLNTLYVRSRDRAGNLSSIVAYQFFVGSTAGALTAPGIGDITSGRTILRAEGRPATSGVRFEWRRADTDAWTAIPTSDVTRAVGGGAVTWPLATSGNGAYPHLNWDVAKTLNDAEPGAEPLDGPLQVRAVFTGALSGAGGEHRITFDRDRASAASESVDIGAVNLLTGDLLVSEPDAAVDGLGLSRSYRTRASGGTDPMFGPGWVSSALAGPSPYTKLEVFGSLLHLGLPDGTVLGFTATGNGSTFLPPVGAEGVTVTYAAGPNRYTASDTDGNTVVFARDAAAPAGQYQPISVTTAGSGETATVSWESATVDGTAVMRPTRILAPVPAGVTCTTMVRGCRALTVAYAASTTASGVAFGDYLGRAASVSYTAYDPATSAMRTTVLARYAYDTSGQLRQTWDPRLDYQDGGPQRVVTSYSYHADGVLASITPPGEQPWQLSYTTLPGDSGKGRLHKVTRSALPAGTAVTTVVYRVPVSGSGAPYDLSVNQANRWAQTEPPTDATAVFPATQVPNGNQATGTAPSSYERASITYLDANGRVVNTAAPGGGIATIWYDQYGNVVRELSAGNRERALTASELDTTERENMLAKAFSTLNAYSSNGQRLVLTLEPEHTVQLPDGSLLPGRRYTTFSYDQGAPVGGSDGNGAPFDLVTTETVGFRWWDSSGVEHNADARAVRTEYDWAAKLPVKSIIDPGGRNLATRTDYDSAGRVVAETTPAGGNSNTTPATRVTVYYTTGANSADSRCGNRPEWFGLVCLVRPGGQPATGAELATTINQYGYYGELTTGTEVTSAGTLRTTTTIYDQAGRAAEVTISAPGLGEPVQKRRSVFDPVTGQLTHTQTIAANGTVSAEISRSYDSLGRMVSYRDADGNTSTFSYDVLSRLVTAGDGKATRTYHYDEGTERRGLATSVVDSELGRFTGGYDTDGNLVTQSWPNGVDVTTTVNREGTLTGISYQHPGCGQEDCTLYAETAQFSIHGEWLDRTSTLSVQRYGYDEAGRLDTVEDLAEDDCSTRRYQFDNATNRTGLTRYGPAESGQCQRTTADGSTTWSYDTANRVTTSGYSYDALGRALTMPGHDAATPNTGTVTIGYYANDMARSITYGSRAGQYTLDVSSNRYRSWTDTGSGGGVTKTHHYASDDDSPSWTDEGNGTYSRPIAGVGGLVALRAATSGTSYLLTNLHGDFVAGMQVGGVGLDYTTEYLEHGQPRDGDDIGSRRYGWLGSAQRQADTPGGLILMGARLYAPGSGRFQSPDPVYGGNANAYEYCSGDSVGCSDTTGLVPTWLKNSCGKYSWRSNRWSKTSTYRNSDPLIPYSKRVWHRFGGTWNVRCLVPHSVAYYGLNVGGPAIGAAIGAALGFACSAAAIFCVPAFAAIGAAAGALGPAVYNDRCTKKRGFYIRATIRYTAGYHKFWMRWWAGGGTRTRWYGSAGGYAMGPACAG